MFSTFCSSIPQIQNVEKEEMLSERGVEVDHLTIYRWVQYYTPKILEKLKDEGKCSSDLEHEQVKHLNTIIESDHRKMKRRIRPTLEFKSMKTACATIKGFEVMRMLKKGRFEFWKYGQDIQGEIRIITDNLLVFL